MKKNNFLVLVTSKEMLSKLKDNESKIDSNITYLYPLSDFTVGFPTTFNISDIRGDAYIFVNRILDNEGISLFKDLLSNLTPNIKGIVFDDLGVLNVLKNTPNNLKKILFLNHLNCNYESINGYLEYVDSVVPSVDLTIKELKEILLKAKKPLVTFTFGHVNIMYSRRLVITNYNKYFKEKSKLVNTIEEAITKENLKIIENVYGTVIYTDKPFNALELLEEENTMFSLINTLFLNNEEILNILKNPHEASKLYPYKYLSVKDTIYKLKGDKNA